MIKETDLWRGLRCTNAFLKLKKKKRKKASLSAECLLFEYLGYHIENKVF